MRLYEPSLLNNAFSTGLYFLAGQDAGPGSAHPLANVWDNGKHPVDELERMMKIRSVALSTFLEKRMPVDMKFKGENHSLPFQQPLAIASKFKEFV